MPNYPNRTPSDEHEANARARSPEVELNVLLAFHRLEEYSPYISIEDAESPSYRIECDDGQQSYMASVWLTPYNPKMFWIVSGWTINEKGEKAEFHKYYFDTRQNALLYVLEKFRDNGFAPHCEWTEWTNTDKGVEERECLLCPKAEVRDLALPQSKGY